MEETDVVVIGAGPGGYAAAFYAADHGVAVTLVDADPKPGGVCLHRGCIPSKALLHMANLLHEVDGARECGIVFEKPKIDHGVLRQWCQGVIDRLAEGVAQLCKRRKVRLVQGQARFRDSRTLELHESNGARPPFDAIRFEHAIIATGSRPVIPPKLRVEDPRIMDSTSALRLPDIPRNLLVVGGGYIGLELGSVYATLGSRVMLVELTDGLLPGVDRDLVRPLQQRLGRLFQAIHLQSEVTILEPAGDGIVARWAGQSNGQGSGITSQETFDRVLVAVGRRSNSDGLGIENTGVRLDEKGFIQVDRQLRTHDDRILAIGDVIGEPMLAHKASHDGKAAAQTILGQEVEHAHLTIPAVVFTDPEIAWCGLTEERARKEGREVRVVRFPWGASGRAQTLGRPEGQTKLIFDPISGRVLGVGIVGAGAGELIAEGVWAVQTEASARDIARCIHPHPTLTETIAECAEAFLGHATHLFRPPPAG